MALNGTIADLGDVRGTWDNIPSMDTAHVMYYDIESLLNIFTVSVYSPRQNHLILFYLCDDAEIESRIETRTAIAEILGGNPFINRQGESHHVKSQNVRVLNLKNRLYHDYLCHLLGLAFTKDVNMTREASTFPINNTSTSKMSSADQLARHAFLSDTHINYDPKIHHIVAGYNSNEYDTTMMAKYYQLSEKYLFEKRELEKARLAVIQRNQRLPADMQETVPEINIDPCDFPMPTAGELRDYNDELFAYDGRMSMIAPNDSELGEIRLAMINSGRYIDIALLNEKMKFVKLKRLCGTLGFQILESEKLSGPEAFIENVQDFYDLLTYNASDTINLYRLAHHPLYKGAFDQKAELIHRYPESVFRQGKRDEEKPCIRSNNVDSWRLKIDSTSAQIVARFLAPYKPLDDIDAVSFNYPSPKIIAEKAEQGIHVERFNVLNWAEDFFKNNVSDQNARASIEEAFGFYREIEGKNFNDNPRHVERLRETNPDVLGPYGGAHDLKEIPKTRLNVPYYRLDGTPTDCYVTFSTGGIHGAQLNSSLRDKAVRQIQAERALVERVKSEFPDATEMRQLCGKQPVLDSDGNPILNSKGKPLLTKDLVETKNDGEEPVKLSTNYIRLANGEFVPHKAVLATGSTIKHGCSYKEIEDDNALTRQFIENDGSNSPNPKLAYTTIGRMVHQDFTSYYPSLLTNMSAFDNPALGIDRYVMAYEEKNDLGRLKKEAQANKNWDLFTKYNTEQKGMKLILNSASGAADAQRGKKIRLNNTVISMRIIGQLFTWAVAQAQVFKGASMPSTNTDGIYAQMKIEDCESILKEFGDKILVEIEPEELLLVSKDSNNRLELKIRKDSDDANLTMKDITEIGASGAALVCHEGPNPGNSLDHAAVLDYIMVQYLSELALQKNNAEARNVAPRLKVSDPFNRDVAMRFIDGVLSKPIPVVPDALPWEPMEPISSLHAMKLFQTIITANPKALAFPFGVLADSEDTTPRILQDINRVFFVREDTSLPGREILHLHKANGAKISTPALAKMNAENRRPVHGVLDKDTDESKLAYRVLEKKGFTSPLEFSLDGSKPDEHKSIGLDREVKVTKIKGIDPTLRAIVVNEDIECMSPKQMHEILDALDIEAYLDMAESTFETSWRNEE